VVPRGQRFQGVKIDVDKADFAESRSQQRHRNLSAVSAAEHERGCGITDSTTRFKDESMAGLDVVVNE